MHGFDWSKWTTGTSAERLGLLPAGQEHVLQQEDGKARFTKVVTDISRAFALCAAHDEAIRLRDDIAFFQAVRSALVKPSGERKTQEAFGASQRLIANGLRPLALNFANGIHPGGGFLHGARAQEETICRSSALYSTLDGDRMYSAHRRRPRSDSSDWSIYSPDVPVFRSDDGTELEEPWLLSVITCAAPYAPDIGQPESGDLLQQRIHRVLLIARAYGYSTLVLGAWGCGAFANDIRRTAKDFRSAIENDFRGVFGDVVFAITDWSRERMFLGPFRDTFERNQ